MYRFLLLTICLGLLAPGLADAAPVLIYHMDEDTGTIVDAAANGNDGAFDGLATDYGTQGRFGTSLQFRGGQEINAGNGFDLNDRSFTIETWIRPDAAASRGSQELIASKPEGSTYHNLHLRLYNTNNLRFAFFGDDMNSGNNAVGDEKWQHVAFVFQKNGSAPHNRYIYVDGVQVASDTPSYVYQGTGGNFYVGSWDTSQFLHGRLDEFRVYDHALDATAVADHARGVYGDHAPRVPLLVMHMDDASNPIAEETGNYPGNYNGAGFGVPSRSGTALRFDGNDRIQVATDRVLDFDNKSFTIEMWVKQDPATGEQVVASKIDEGGTNKNMHLRLYPNGAIRMDWYGNSANAAAGTFEQGEWHHLAFTYDYDELLGTGVRRIFYDADIVAEQSAATPYLGTGGNFYIGSWGTSQYFKGLIDEFRVYNYALDQDTVREHLSLFYRDYQPAVPEPAAAVLLLVGLAALPLGSCRRRRRRRVA